MSRAQDGQHETEQPDHSASLGDSIASSTQIRFSVHTPAYLEKSKPPENPQDLLSHRLLAFAYFKAENSWTFHHVNGKDKETLSFLPHLSMNDFTGLASALVAGGGIGDLPPVVQPELVRDGRLIEVMPEWRFRSYDLLMVHLGNRHVTRTLRVFKEFAAQMIPTLFPDLPS